MKANVQMAAQRKDLDLVELRRLHEAGLTQSRRVTEAAVREQLEAVARKAA